MVDNVMTASGHHGRRLKRLVFRVAFAGIAFVMASWGIWRVADHMREGASFRALPEATRQDTPPEREQKHNFFIAHLTKWPVGRYATKVRQMQQQAEQIWREADEDTDFAALLPGVAEDGADARERKRWIYVAYLKKWRDGRHAAKVHEIQQQAEATWRLTDERGDLDLLPKADAADTEDNRVAKRVAYKGFLTKWPQGAHVGVVRQRQAEADAIWAQADFARLQPGMREDSADLRERKRSAYAGFLKAWPIAAQVAQLNDMRKQAEETWLLADEKADFDALPKADPADSEDNRVAKRVAYKGFLTKWPQGAHVGVVRAMQTQAENMWEQSRFDRLVAMKPNDSLDTIRMLRVWYVAFVKEWPDCANSKRVTEWMQDADQRIRELELQQGNETFATLQPVTDRDSLRERQQKFAAYANFLTDYPSSPHRPEVERLQREGQTLHGEILRADRYKSDAEDAIRRSGRTVDLHKRYQILRDFLASTPASLPSRATSIRDEVVVNQNAARRKLDDWLWSEALRNIQQASQNYAKTLELVDAFLKEAPEHHRDEAQAKRREAELDLADQRRWQDIAAYIQKSTTNYETIVSQIDTYLAAAPRQNRVQATKTQDEIIAAWDKRDYQALWQGWKRATTNPTFGQLESCRLRVVMSAYERNERLAGERRTAVRKWIQWYDGIVNAASLRIEITPDDYGAAPKDADVSSANWLSFQSSWVSWFPVTFKWQVRTEEPTWLWTKTVLKTRENHVWLRITPLSRGSDFYDEDHSLIRGHSDVRVGEQPDLPAYPGR